MAQHDYTIANQSGAAFRADLNNALAAAVSQNSGANEPSVTYAYMPWADTTAGVLKIRNAANSAWITLYQLDGEWSTIALEDGTAAAPALYFKDSGTDTGVYSPGVDQVGIATAGVQRVNFNGATEVVFNDGGADVDFRVEGDTKPNLFKVDAGTDAVSVDGDFSVTGTVSGTITRATAVASTSGTEIDFTSIPSWVKRITVMFAGVSTNGTSNLRVQIGAGSVATSGYLGSSVGILSNVGFSSLQSGSGFDISDAAAAAAVRHGAIKFVNITGNTWVVDGVMGQSDTTRTAMIGGSIALAGTLDRIRITTVNGTDTFDAGTINILYEG